MSAMYGADITQLHVRAVDPFSGQILGTARVVVETPARQVVCEGRNGVAECNLPAGDYLVKARLSGFGASLLPVTLKGETVYRKIALWIEDPIDYGRIGALKRKNEARTGKILSARKSALGYWVRIAAVHNFFQDATYTSSGDFTFDGLKPGLYQMTVSDNGISRSFLLAIHDRCSVFSVPIEGVESEISCR